MGHGRTLTKAGAAEREKVRSAPVAQGGNLSGRGGVAILKIRPHRFREWEPPDGPSGPFFCALIHLSPDSPDRLGRQARKPRKRWVNCRFVLSPVGSARI